MKKYLLPSIKITIILSILFGGLFPLALACIAKLAPGKGDGVKVTYNGKVVGYELIGQKFTKDKYFWGRPSAVDYNAAGSGGSNRGPSNPEYLKQVQNRIDTFLVHNPTITKSEIPAELVTASGSGLDPNISPKGAAVQAARVAKVRNISLEKVNELITKHTEHHTLGPTTINLLKLNVALDELK
ncbi:K(+)-transporting ATPase subunit C [Solitalea koreensis]|uniref:Potassium-transporting ATPase KdpC subunit n=1 Tax=Solitalea koreensis TaxID=543615 RepID=A0A521C4A9_9SPHI|nr:K(+)-transporting ATPase subunit C [Solitalea koreensis]SMO54282.1 K+-transporting ATPase ATPase C chain [Solitalea koreensis]